MTQESGRIRVARIAQAAQQATAANDVQTASELVNDAFAIIDREGSERDAIFIAVLLAAADCADAAGSPEAAEPLYNRAAWVCLELDPEGRDHGDLGNLRARAWAWREPMRRWGERSAQESATRTAFNSCRSSHRRRHQQCSRWFVASSRSSTRGGRGQSLLQQGLLPRLPLPQHPRTAGEAEERKDTEGPAVPDITLSVSFGNCTSASRAERTWPTQRTTQNRGALASCPPRRGAEAYFSLQAREAATLET